MLSSGTNFTIPVYNYTSENFNYIISEDSNAESELDKLLKEKWKIAEINNVFRYTLNIKEWKILEGQYKYLAQLNVDRAINRRKPEVYSSINQPFDPDKFNFTNLPEKEICFDIEDESGNNIIAINISPIEWGHCLFIPERFSNLPQRLTEQSLTKAIELLLLSSSPNLRVAFNSLGAYASINHLHWHLYYLKHRLLLETIETNNLVGSVFTLDNFPSKGFCIKLSAIPEHDIKTFIKISYLIIKYLQCKELAYNIYITRSKCDPRNNVFNDIRLYIWARKPIYGFKNGAFIPAVCELFGHLVIRSEEAYKNINEEFVANVLNKETFDIFSSICNDIKILINKT